MYEGTILIKEMAQRSCHNYLTGMLVRLTKYLNARHAQLITINTYLCIVLYIHMCMSIIDRYIHYLRSCVLI